MTYTYLRINDLLLPIGSVWERVRGGWQARPPGGEPVGFGDEVAEILDSFFAGRLTIEPNAAGVIDFDAAWAARAKANKVLSMDECIATSSIEIAKVLGFRVGQVVEFDAPGGLTNGVPHIDYRKIAARLNIDPEALKGED